MKRTLVVVASMLPLLWLSPAAHAGHLGWDHDGTIQLPNPASPIAGSLTENLGECDSGSDYQDLDGHWLALPGGTGDGSHPIVLTPGEATTDVDGFFYTSGCEFIEEETYTLAEGLIGQTETGTIPAGAAYVVVNNSLSVGPATFTIGSS